MLNSPLVSILIPNFNNGQYLEECLESVFKQTYRNWEVIIVDDGSIDDSKLVYEKFADSTNLNIYLNAQNKGVAYTRHKLIGYAQGEFSIFLDPDDTIVPDAIETLIESYEKNGEYSIVYSTHYVCDENLTVQSIASYVGEIKQGEFLWSTRGFTISNLAMIRTAAYFKTEGVSPWFYKAVDKDLYSKLQEVGPVKFVDKPLLYYRIHKNSISKYKNRRIAKLFGQAAYAMVQVRGKVTKADLKKMKLSKYKRAAALWLIGSYVLLIKKNIHGIKILWDAIYVFHVYIPIGIFSILIKVIEKKLVRA
jgi:glycosyltransferase involved in cell wall biosynthesis